ncbi:helix-turn-helix domain-containing protein [Thiothrix nivea]|uniref:Helix-turn-helix domain protein n=1 Tax=Thiothrix nivea (strain ATCC 35100 / DSM 5205 / JP2) TaxID=870187 RepID=A0A656HEL7_THINJ|nr:helix-turn-helix domain-containing protein [Thiothrix nivea]EIJ34434.1 helix-turn-helix domain protein [Thiothrix nivea DSM 5205]
MPITFQTPESLLATVAAQARAQRLAANLTRRTLAEKSGVAEGSIKRFETSGQISFHSLLKLAFALDCMDAFQPLFAAKPPQSIAELQARPRQRGSL